MSTDRKCYLVFESVKKNKKYAIMIALESERAFFETPYQF